MRDALVDDPADVHFIQIQCPLLIDRVAARCRGARAETVTDDTTNR